MTTAQIFSYLMGTPSQQAMAYRYIMQLPIKMQYLYIKAWGNVNRMQMIKAAQEIFVHIDNKQVLHNVMSFYRRNNLAWGHKTKNGMPPLMVFYKKALAIYKAKGNKCN